MSWFCAIALAAVHVGCAHSVALRPDEVSGVARFRDTGAVEVHDGARSIRVTSDHEPTLKLKLSRSCSFWQYLRRRCDKIVTSSLSDVQPTPQGIELQVTTSVFLGHKRAVQVALPEIESAELSIDDYVPDGWRPHWGIGFAVAGPIGIGGVVVQYLPARWFAIEAGTLPAAHLFSGYAGARLRPVGLGPVRPFVGGFASYAAFFEVTSGRSESMAAVGPRAGLDLSIFSGRGLVTVELDLAHPLEDDRMYWGDLQGRWILWGGGAVSYMF